MLTRRDPWRISTSLNDERLEETLYAYVWLSVKAPNSHVSRIDALMQECRRRGRGEIAERVQAHAASVLKPVREIPPAGFPLYLIAFADHTIHTAISYRVDGNTLNYLTHERDPKAVPLNAVDRALSTQLNRERQVFFELPQ